MPSLSHLALRYLLWLIGLRIAFGLLENFAGLPPSSATGVIIAAAPLAEIANFAVRRASRRLVLRDWAVVWGMCLGIFVVMQVILPALILPPMRAALGTAEGFAQVAMIVAATGIMGVLFLWIGSRSATGPGR
jgi:hypothetical protein